MHRTALYDFHKQHGAKLVEFAGWEMPIMYRSIREEHRSTRQHGAVFDVSHMGRLQVGGQHARRLLERVLTRRVTDMKQNTCRYSLICNEQGGTLDDVIVYRRQDDWLLVVNAANREKILGHLAVHAVKWNVDVEDQTMDSVMVAVQGPRVIDLIGQVIGEVPALKRYHFCVKQVLPSTPVTISRTGYTGEDGVEVILAASIAHLAVRHLLKSSEPADSASFGLAPAGLGARDSLRIEAGLPLYGHELDEQTDPFAAGLNFAVSLDKDEHDDGVAFVGQAALKQIVAEGPRRRLIGLKLDGRRTARQGMAVMLGDLRVGAVTSGCLSPTLDVPIAMAFVEPGAIARPSLRVDLGSRCVDAEVVELPFYRRR